MKGKLYALRIAFALVILISVVNSAGNVLLASPNNIASEEELFADHVETAVIETIVFTALAKILLNKKEPLALVKSLGYGVGSWGAGQVAEIVYKKVCQMMTNKSLRMHLGKSIILGMTVDNERLLRRAVTLAILSASLYWLEA